MKTPNSKVPGLNKNKKRRKHNGRPKARKNGKHNTPRLRMPLGPPTLNTLKVEPVLKKTNLQSNLLKDNLNLLHMNLRKESKMARPTVPKMTKIWYKSKQKA